MTVIIWPIAQPVTLFVSFFPTLPHILPTFFLWTFSLDSFSPLNTSVQQESQWQSFLLEEKHPGENTIHSFRTLEKTMFVFFIIPGESILRFLTVYSVVSIRSKNEWHCFLYLTEWKKTLLPIFSFSVQPLFSSVTLLWFCLQLLSLIGFFLF